MTMSEINHTVKLTALLKNYYQHHISFDEYRSHRKVILDKIDEELNGQKIDKEKKDEEAEAAPHET